MGRRLAIALAVMAGPLLAAPAAGASWERIAALPRGRADLAAVRALDRHGHAHVYALGGVRRGPPFLSADARVYLQGSGRWRTLAPMPVARAGAAVVSWRSRIFLLGGAWHGRRAGEPVSRGFSRWDTRRGGWEQRTKLPSPRRDAAAAALVHRRRLRIFLVGGVGPRRARALSGVAVYVAERRRWQRGPDLPEPRMQACAVAARGRIFVFGGRRAPDGPPTASVYVLRPGHGHRWQRLDDMPLPRAQFGAALVDGRIYVVGGMGPRRKVLRSVQVFDPSTGAWHSAPSLPRPRRALGVAATRHALFAIGGRARPSRSSRPLGTVYRLRVG